MLGSLQSPPIIVRSSRRKWFLILCAAVFFVWAALLPDLPAVMKYLGLFFFGAGIPIAVFKLIKPDTLEINPQGIEWRSSFQTQHYRWRDVANFRTYRPTSKTPNSHVGFDFAPEYTAKRAARSVAKHLAGVEGSLGGDWEISASELANMLNAGRAQWLTTANCAKASP
jgi:hypothetical protein